MGGVFWHFFGMDKQPLAENVSYDDFLAELGQFQPDLDHFYARVRPFSCSFGSIQAICAAKTSENPEICPTFLDTGNLLELG